MVYQLITCGSIQKWLFGAVMLAYLQAQALAQLPSPAQWQYPFGNAAAVRTQAQPSAPQSLNAFRLKWSTSAIAGDVLPLIGDVVRNAPLAPTFSYTPLEVVAALGGKIITVDGRGKTRRSSTLPAFARSISFLADSTLLPPQLRSRVPSLLFLESAEFAATADTVAAAYIAGHDSTSDTIAVVTRLTYDLRSYKPNLFAWVKPIFALPAGSGLAVYAAAGTTAPHLDSVGSPPYLRGVTVTRLLPALLGGTFPIPDAGDNVGERFTVAPHLAFQQPSLVQEGVGIWTMYLPCTTANDTATVSSPYGTTTNARRVYLFSLRCTNGFLAPALPPLTLDTLLSAPLQKPFIAPYGLALRDAGIGGQWRRYILLAESYLGRDTSYGQAQLHLLASDGTILTSPRNTASPSFRGRWNHSWSIAVGDLDGSNPANELLPFYPNNPGPEIILTESTRDYAVAGSRLMVLRYRSGTPTPKPSPAGATLAPLDTIVTFPITGWLAAVADLDSASDGKAELLLADRSDLLVLRLRDYSDPRFRTGTPFDTVWSWNRPGEEITSVAIADVDGDSRHDIIVTTTAATYAFGIIPQRVLRCIAPLDTTSQSPLVFCTNDTVSVEWSYLYAGDHLFTIGFQPYAGQPLAPIGTVQILARDIANSSDTARWYQHAKLLQARAGRFIVWLTADSTVRDSSQLVAIVPGQLRFDTTTLQPRYTAASVVFIGGVAVCVDTLTIVGSLDGGRSWQVLESSSVLGQGTFLARVQLPCIAFPPYGASDTLLLVRAIGISTPDTTISDTLRLRLSPAGAALTIQPDSVQMCCSYTITALSAQAPCDTALVLVQYSQAEQYVALDTVTTGSVTIPGRQGSSDTVRIRWACIGSCVRVDTFITPAAPRFFQGIAPNPVDRTQELCRILTTPPRTTTVTLRIFDQSDRLVRTLVRSELRQERQLYCDIWDCRTDSGELVPPGMYYIVAESADGWRAFEAVYVR